MNVLIDTNIAIDVLLKRTPYYGYSQLILLLSEEKDIDIFISASAVTDVFYIINKTYKNSLHSQNVIENLLEIINVAVVDEDMIHEALDAKWVDFEDCVQFTAGESISAKYIITRNPKDFINQTIEIVSPKEFINIISPE